MRARSMTASLFWIGAVTLGCNAILGIEELTPHAHLDADQSGRSTARDGSAPPGDSKPHAPPDAGTGGVPGAEAMAEATGAGPEASPLAAEAGPDTGPDASSNHAPIDATPDGEHVDGDAGPPTEAGPVCESAEWPDPPAESGTDAGGDIDFVVAMKTIDLGDILGPEGPSYRTVGFDLDGRCTAPGQGSGSCRTPDWATDHGDGVFGIDNAMGLFFNGARELLTEGPSVSYNKLINYGVATVLFRVRDYNGAANDPQVRVGFYTPGPRLSPSFVPVPPEWDGQDVWPILDESLEPVALPDGGMTGDIDRPIAADLYAYVTDGVLVANVPSASLRVPSPIVGPPGQIIIRISGAVVVGRIEQANGVWEIRDATLAGRWRMQDLLSQMSQFPSRVDNSKKTPLCTNVGDYGKWKEDFCSLVDILAGHGTVNTPCDALSVGIRFDTGAARLGPVIPTPPQPPRCPPQFDPAGDSCGP